ncbi:protein of unknown function [Candidatus Methylomirabilis oxygeniifera]|uniref:Uncharacterized protein n=1 Tax=Methylomirabilis oxygeniifera TaxID=671143 RepID=D5MGK8_METO1|nr:protein of unknown function [Candidatus Methylomirabilis oxyfera]
MLVSFYLVFWRQSLRCPTKPWTLYPKPSIFVARPGRLELPTYCLEGSRSIRLSYGRLEKQLSAISFQ